MPVNLDLLLAILNQSKVLPKNDALYLVIKNLIISSKDLNELIENAGSLTALGLGQFLAYGTHAERLVFQPTIIPGTLVIYFETDTSELWVFTDDWVQASGGITELTGDVLAGPGSGSVAATLSTTGVTAGTYGSSTLSAVVTVDAAGRLTAATTAVIAGSSTGNYQLIQSIAVSGTSTTTFSSITGYKHLKLEFQARSTEAAVATNLLMRLNNDTTASYDSQWNISSAAINGAGQALGATTATISNISGSTAPTGYAGVGEVTFFNYNGTTFQKGGTSIAAYPTTTASGGLSAWKSGWHWRNTNAVTTITLFLAASSFGTGTEFNLYGIN